MSARPNRGSFLIILVLGGSLISALPPANDVDASIAKLINGYVAPGTPPTPLGGRAGPLGGPHASQGSETRQVSGSGTNPQPQAQPPQQNHQSHQKPAPTLNVANGTVTGRTLTVNNLDGLPSISTNECQVFLGIPYAAPPVDQLRFKVTISKIRSLKYSIRYFSGSETPAALARHFRSHEIQIGLYPGSENFTEIVVH